MLQILLLLAVSTGLGVALRKVRMAERFSRTSQYTVYIMLLVFGMSIGSSKDTMNRLDELGIQAAIIAVAGVAGSILAICIFSKTSSRKGGKQ